VPQARRNSPHQKRRATDAMGASAASSRHLRPDPGTPFISAFIDEGGQVAVQRVADSFGMSKGQLAETVGLGREGGQVAVQRVADSFGMSKGQLAETVGRAFAWADGNDEAMAWSGAQPIAAFGDRTADALVKSGHATEVRDYLDHLALGFS